MPRKPKVIINGWINLNKPVGMTSNDALNIVKRAMGYPKIGHAGTLDPMASGILPIAMGEATKLVQYMMEDDKVYIFTVQWGSETTTDDLEGTVTETSPKRPSREDILSILPEFQGRILQKPPAFSAVKIDGERAYDLARKGETIALLERPVDIYEINLVETTDETATFRVVCGKGTYVRSLARDMGRKLGCFGHVISLTRESVGPFFLQDAISLDFFKENSDNTPRLQSTVLSIETVLDDIPVLAMNDQEAQKLRNGQKISFIARHDVQRLVNAGLEVGTDHAGAGLALAMLQGKAIALLEVTGVEAQPVRVFNL